MQAKHGQNELDHGVRIMWVGRIAQGEPRRGGDANRHAASHVPRDAVHPTLFDATPRFSARPQ